MMVLTVKMGYQAIQVFKATLGSRVHPDLLGNKDHQYVEFHQCVTRYNILLS